MYSSEIMENNKRFQKAKDKIIGMERLRKSIGVLQEKTVHAILKNYYEPCEDYHEIPVEGLVADIYNNGEIIEIQTAHFDKLRDKLGRFLPYHDVTVVYPVSADKWLIYIDKNTGEVTSKRKSPRHGTTYDIFPELYKIKNYLNNEHIHFVIVLMDMEEYKMVDSSKTRGRRKRSTRYDRIPLCLKQETVIERREDYMQFLPMELPEEFTSRDLANVAGIPVALAQVTLNILTHTKNVERIGKKGRSILYRVNEI